MNSHLNSKQVVLFDGEAHSTALFNDIQQLLNIPKNCQFYIFSNETDPIRNNIQKYADILPQVHIQQSAIPIDERILTFLRTDIDQYSFILIVCGQKPTYEYKIKDIRRKYLKKKLYTITKNITLENIFDQLRQYKVNHELIASNTPQVFADYSCPQCPKKFYSNDELKEHCRGAHTSFTNTNLYVDSSINESYSKKNNKDETLIIAHDLFCNECNEYFQSMGEFKKHQKEAHKDLMFD